MHLLPHIFALNHKGKDIELREVYLSIGLRSFAFSLVAIFIPIFLYTLNGSVREVLLYFLYYMGLGIPLCILIGHFTSKHGAKKSIAISYVVTIISLLLLTTLQTYHWPLILIALVAQVAATLFWNAYQLNFSKVKKQKEDGKEVGFATALVKFSGLVSPFVGGLIASYGGITLSFLVCSILLGFAMFPLLTTKEVVKKREINYKNINIKRILPDAISYGSGTVEAATFYIVWPLITFIFLKEYVYVGLLTTLASIFVVIFIISFGKYVDRHDKRKLLQRGAYLNILQNLYRIFVESTVGIFTANIVTNIINTMWQIPWEARKYERADEEPRAEYIFILEMASHVFRFFFILILFVATYFLSERDTLVLGLILTAVASLGIGRMK